MAINKLDTGAIQDNAITNAKMADDAVGVADLAATGTPSNTTFLRGDNAWATPTDTNTTYSVQDGELSQNNFTNDDHTKLNNIEASADVTDATNVAAAGALMDSELAGIAAVKATTGTFLTADQTKLDGIAASANNYVHPNHSGDVVSAADGAMTIQTDAVDIAMLSATGTPGSTTFLRGDNAWATAGSTSASDLTSGTLPDARFPSTLPAISGANLTGIDAATVSTTAPSSPAAGDMWFDTTSGTTSMKVYSGTEWNTMSNQSIHAATGGTITTYGVYKVHVFTSSGTFTPDASAAVDYLVVGGGGAGSTNGGGGGAGGFRTGTLTIGAGAYSITVGAGGTGGSYPSLGTNGGNSVFSSITSIGGGGGGLEGLNGAVGVAGGSGGGGGYLNAAGGAGTSGQGNAGAASTQGSDGHYGGGGGASAAGSGMNAGNGTQNALRTGSNIYYSGGGGGGRQQGSPGGTAGLGGGSAGLVANSTSSAATANTGGGGGGSAGGGGVSGNGGSGIVIIRYVA